jgi:NAD(P)-dependent dehydrogenase (short-subunit alcohol dehydrogenase family)
MAGRRPARSVGQSGGALSVDSSRSPAGALAGRTALVTGSSRGIGRAVAVKLAELGADVAVNYVTREQDAAEVVERLGGLGRRSFAMRADVSNLDELGGLFDRVATQWGALDIYVNNAIDVASFGPVLRLRPDPWRHTIDSHITTFLVGAQRAAKLMAGRRGAIVALSSLGSRGYIPGYAPIGVGKAGIEALTRYLAVELGPAGVRVNTVSAGPIDTDALRRFSTYDQMKEASTRLAPGRRMGCPEDVADVVAFLCTDQARWIYGQTLVVDGGLSLLSAH